MDATKQILDRLPTSVFVKNENLQFEFSNAAHCEIIGVAAEKLLGLSDQDFYPAEEAAGFLARDRSVIEAGETVEAEEDVTNQTGHTRPYLTRKSKLTAANGKNYLIGTNTNLSEIRKREEQYRALAHTVPVGVWQVNESGQTIFANARFMSYLGIDVEAVAETDLIALLSASRSDFPGQACRFETDVGSDLGQDRRLLIISSGWLQLSGEEARSAIISAVDISEMTELKRVNEEISRLNRELDTNVRKLREAQDEILRRGRMAQLGQLTATVAHEIRNPLGAVKTAAFLIERKVKDKNLGIDQQLQRIGNGITRCDAIITQLLDFSRSRALQLETVAIDEWLSHAVTEEAGKLPGALSIICQLGLPGREARIDTCSMNRMIINLLSNASEALVGKGDVPSNFVTSEPRIAVETRSAPRGIEITVSDNGPGIAPENMRKILEPLFTTKSFGTGLGLPAVEKILQEHGGGLEISLQPGGGASFTAWFPCGLAAEKAA